MTVSPIQITLHDNVARLDINSEITENLATAMEAGLEKLFHYYKYDRIVLRINSPGGLLNALRHMLQYMQHWRNRGCLIDTEVTFSAASAAAVLLSFGQVGSRTAHQHTSLLFHHARISGTTNAITATGAKNIASALKTTDQGLLLRLVEHVVAGSGGTAAYCAQGIARCDLLSNQAAAIANALELPTDKKSPSWLKSIAKMYLDVDAKKNPAPYMRYLAARMEIDSPMDLREAYVLCLLDRVYGAPELCFLPTICTSPRLQEPQRHISV